MLLVHMVHRPASGLSQQRGFLRNPRRLAHGLRLFAFLNFVYQPGVVHILETRLSLRVVLDDFVLQEEVRAT